MKLNYRTRFKEFTNLPTFLIKEKKITKENEVDIKKKKIVII